MNVSQASVDALAPINDQLFPISATESHLTALLTDTMEPGLVMKILQESYCYQ